MSELTIGNTEYGEGNVKSTFDEIKTILFYLIVSFGLFVYSLTQLSIIFNMLIIFMVIYACCVDSYKNYTLIIFILPLLDIFIASGSGFSYATLLLMLISIKHIISRFKIMSFRPLGLIVVLVVVIYEALHIYGYDRVDIIPTVRWITLFIYASLIIIDRNFKPNFKKITHFFIAGIIVSSVCGYVISLSKPVVTNANVLFRFEGVGGDPNGFAMMILMAALFLINIYIRNNKFTKTYACLFILLVMLGFTTLSRSYLLTLGCMIGFIFVYSLFTRNLKILRLQVVILFMSLAILVIFYDPIVQLLSTIVDRMTMSDDIQDVTGSRALLAELYWKSFVESSLPNMLFGKGVVGYLGLYHISILGELAGPHNTYLETLVAWGVCGILILSSYIIVMYKCQAHKYIYVKPTFISYLPAVGLMIYLMSLQSLGKYNTYLYLTLILMNMFYSEEKETELDAH